MGKLLLSDDEVQVIAMEAFMMGRIYHAGGEKEPPREIHTKLMLSVGAALVRYRQAERKRRRAERREHPR